MLPAGDKGGGRKRWCERIVALVMTLSACNPQSFISKEESQLAAGESTSDVVEVYLAFPMIPHGLSLAGTLSTVDVAVNGCVSGFAQSFQLGLGENSLVFVAGDSGCRGSVQWFVYDGREFSPDGPFNTEVGEKTGFHAEDGTTLQVVVLSQLSDSITPDSELLAFSFLEVTQGDSHTFAEFDFSLVTAVCPLARVHEGIGVVSCEVRREGNLGQAIDVAFSIEGTALPGEDYLPPSGVVEMGIGETSVPIDISIVNDDAVEYDETLILSLSDGSGYVRYGASQTIIITDDDFAVPTNGLVAKYAPESLVNSGGLISQWTDLSSSDHSATQSNSSYRPLWLSESVSGYDAAGFDGNDDILIIGNSGDFNTAGPYDNKTIAVVFRTAANVVSRQVIYEQGGSTRGLNIFIENGLVYFNGWNLANDDNGATTPWGPKWVSTGVSAGTTYVGRLVFDATTGAIAAYLNGMQIGVVNGVGRLFSHSDAIGIGGVTGSSYSHSGSLSSGSFFVGSVAEFYKFNGPLSAVEGQDLDAYLLSRYGFEVPITVSVTANPEVELENSGNSVEFLVTRSVVDSSPLVVSLNASGTATAGEDYSTVPDSVVIPEFARTVSFSVALFDDSQEEGDETLTVVAAPAASYEVGGSAVLTIIDDEIFVPPAGLVRRFRADEGVSVVGAGVSSWASLGAPSFTAYQTNSSYRPILMEELLGASLPGVLFDQNNDLLVVDNDASINSAGPYVGKTFAFVFRAGSNISTRQVIWEQGAGVRGINLHIDSSELRFTMWNLNNDDGGATTPWGPATVSAPLISQTLYRVVCVFNQAESTMRMWVNGIERTAVSGGVGKLYAHTGAVGLGAINSTAVFADGSSLGSGASFGGDLGEMMLFERALSDSEVTALEQYFYKRYFNL